MSPGYGPYFFLSYARTKHDPADKRDPDRWINKLFLDLNENIRTLTGVGPESAGFMDRQNQAGDRWQAELAKALATCRVFIPLYSEQYFQSEHCGKEWYAFARRGANHKALGHDIESAVVPVIWVPVKRARMPGVTKYLNDNQHDLGERYHKEGLFTLTKLDRFRRDYQEIVYRLAQRILEVADKTKITQEEPADYDSLPSAFDGTMADARIQITLLSLVRSSTLPKGRTAACYGTTPRQWSPYRPAYPQPLADYAAELTAHLGCVPDVGIFDDHFAGWSTSKPQSPSLCLIDPWTALSPSFHNKLRKLDSFDSSLVTVLLPWNIKDPEMARAPDALQEHVRSLIGHKLEKVPYRCEMAANGVPTLQDFSDLLPRMIAILQKRFHKEGAVNLPEGPSYERPRLSGPRSGNGEDDDD